jgi:hypothetical protein
MRHPNFYVILFSSSCIRGADVLNYGNFDVMHIFARYIICCLALICLRSERLHAQDCTQAAVPFIFDDVVIDSLNQVIFSTGADRVLMVMEYHNDSLTYYVCYLEKESVAAYRINDQGIYRGLCSHGVLPSVSMVTSAAVCEAEAQLKLIAPIVICPTLVMYQPAVAPMVVQYDSGCSSFDLQEEKRVLREVLYANAIFIAGNITSWTFVSDYSLQY